jgi:hypothetical protein
MKKCKNVLQMFPMYSDRKLKKINSLKSLQRGTLWGLGLSRDVKISHVITMYLYVGGPGCLSPSSWERPQAALQSTSSAQTRSPGRAV